MITAEEYINVITSFDHPKSIGLNYKDIKSCMIEFAKLHVEKALKEASEKANLRFENYKGTWEIQDSYSVDQYTEVRADKESILNSYPLENIK